MYGIRWWFYFIVPHPFQRKKGYYGIVSIPYSFIRLLVRSSVHPFVQTKLCSHRNSATTGLIHSKSSSLELSWPVDVQHHANLPVGPLEPCSQGRGPSSDLLLTKGKGTKKLSLSSWDHLCINLLIHSGFIMPYVIIELGHLWFKEWLGQGWLIISKVLWHSPEGRDSTVSVPDI